MKHTAIYVRVSTKQQKMDSQVADLHAWELSHPEEEGQYYRDSFTGRTMNRPGWNGVMEALHCHQLTRIVVWRLDRLGRTVLGLSKLFAELCECKVPLVSLKDSIDLGTASGRLIAHVLASMAMYETEMRGERVKAGQDAARAKGKKWGGRAGGYTILPPERVELARMLQGQGKSKTYISNATGISLRHLYNLFPTNKVPL